MRAITLIFTSLAALVAAVPHVSTLADTLPAPEEIKAWLIATSLVVSCFVTLLALIHRDWIVSRPKTTLWAVTLLLVGLISLGGYWAAAEHTIIPRYSENLKSEPGDYHYFPIWTTGDLHEAINEWGRFKVPEEEAGLIDSYLRDQGWRITATSAVLTLLYAMGVSLATLSFIWLAICYQQTATAAIPSRP